MPSSTPPKAKLASVVYFLRLYFLENRAASTRPSKIVAPGHLNLSPGEIDRILAGKSEVIGTAGNLLHAEIEVPESIATSSKSRFASGKTVCSKAHKAP